MTKYKYISGLIVAVMLFLSGGIKVINLLAFELKLSTLPWISWNVIPVLSRAIVSLEFFIAVLLILSVFKKWVAKLTIGTLLLFSIAIVLDWKVNGAYGDCGCFGDLISIPNYLALIRNVGLIILTLYSRSNRVNIVAINKQKLIVFLVFIFAISIPYAVRLPDSVTSKTIENDNLPKLINSILWENYNNSDDTVVNIESSDVLFCFFSTSCKHCLDAAKKLTSIQKREKQPLPIYTVFFNEKEEIDLFWKEVGDRVFPQKIASEGIFFQHSGNSLPAIIMVKNRIPFGRLNVRSIHPNQLEFLKE